MLLRPTRAKTTEGTIGLKIVPLLDESELTVRPRSSPAALVRSRVISRPAAAPVPDMLAATSPHEPFSLRQSVAEAQRCWTRGRLRSRLNRDRSVVRVSKIEEWVEKVVQSGPSEPPPDPPKATVYQGAPKTPEPEQVSEAEEDMPHSKKAGQASSKPLELKVGVCLAETVQKDYPFRSPLIVRIRVNDGSRTLPEFGPLLVAAYLTKEDKTDAAPALLLGLTQVECRPLPAECAKSMKDGTKGIAVFENLRVNMAGDYRLRLILFRDFQVVDDITTRRFRVMSHCSEPASVWSSSEKQLITHLVDWKAIVYTPDGSVKAA